MADRLWACRSTAPVAGTKMRTFADHLVPNADGPADDPFTFVAGDIVRLEEPTNLVPGDNRSPPVIGHVAIGSALSTIFVGPIVTIRRLSGFWCVLKIAAAPSL